MGRDGKGEERERRNEGEGRKRKEMGGERKGREGEGRERTNQDKFIKSSTGLVGLLVEGHNW